MKYLMILSCLFLFGCGATNKTESRTEKHTQSTEGDAKLKGDVAIDYPQPNVISPTVSGNSTLEINMAPERVSAKKHKDQSAHLKRDESFSLDSFVESISVTGWILTGILKLAFLAMIFLFLKRTFIGKGIDRVGGEAANFFTRKMQHIDRTDPKWDAYQQSAEHFDKFVRNRGR